MLLIQILRLRKTIILVLSVLTLILCTAPNSRVLIALIYIGISWISGLERLVELTVTAVPKGGDGVLFLLVTDQLSTSQCQIKLNKHAGDLCP